MLENHSNRESIVTVNTDKKIFNGKFRFATFKIVLGMRRRNANSANKVSIYSFNWSFKGGESIKLEDPRAKPSRA